MACIHWKQNTETGAGSGNAQKPIADQVKVYKRTNLVKSEAFSVLIQQALNRYLNGMLTNEEVIQELLKLAKEMFRASEEGNKLGQKCV